MNMQVIVQVLLDVLLLSFISLSNQMNAWGCCLLSKQYVDKEDAVCKVKVSMGPLDKYITKQTLMSLLNKQRGVRCAVLYKSYSHGTKSNARKSGNTYHTTLILAMSSKTSCTKFLDFSFLTKSLTSKNGSLHRLWIFCKKSKMR